MSEQVPEGTVADTLAWVDGDPARAQAALDAEYAGANRSSLINQLEPIAAQEEAPMSEVDTTEPTAEDGIVREEGVEPYPEGNAPPPKPPAGDELVVDVADRATVLGPRNMRTPDIDVPEDNFDVQAADARENEEEAVIDAAPVDFFQLASTNGVVVLRFDGGSFLLDANQAVALARDLRQALANVTY